MTRFRNNALSTFEKEWRMMIDHIARYPAHCAVLALGCLVAAWMMSQERNMSVTQRTLLMVFSPFYMLFVFCSELVAGWQDGRRYLREP